MSLTHWGRVTHICVGNLTIIGSDNGLWICTWRQLFVGWRGLPTPTSVSCNSTSSCHCDHVARCWGGGERPAAFHLWWYRDGSFEGMSIVPLCHSRWTLDRARRWCKCGGRDWSHGTLSSYSIRTHRAGCASDSGTVIPGRWASCQIHKIMGCASARNAGNVFPTTGVSDPGMHPGTCVMHVPWCMLGSLTYT